MPSQIRSFAELIEVLTLQKANLGTYLAAVNATAADVTEVTNDLTNLTSLATFADVVDGYKKAIFEIKQTVYNGEIGAPIPAYPPVLAPPALTAALAGALERARNRNRRFKAAPGYTDVIGDALGIGAGDPTTGIDPQPPTIQVTSAQMGYLFSVVVSNRQQSDQWEVLVQPVGSSTWTTVGTATGKSNDFTYSPGGTASDNPVQLRVMVQLKRNNANYAEPSQIELVTVNP